MSNNNVAMKDDRENLSKVIQANQPKTKSFDPLQNSIQTLQVTENTLTNYIEQIKTNIYVGKKAMYFVARDVYDAKVNLSPSGEIEAPVTKLAFGFNLAFFWFF